MQLLNDARRIAETARTSVDEAQRDLIAEATCLVIDREGLAGASLRRIAQELDCTTGLIQHYFASKDELLVAAMRRAHTHLSRDAGLRPGAHTSLKDGLDAYADGLTRDDRIFWRVYIAYRAAALSNPSLWDEVTRTVAEDMDVLRSSIAAELGAEPEDARVSLVLDALDAVLDGIGMAAVFRPEAYTPERVSDMLDRIVRGLISGEDR